MKAVKIDNKKLAVKEIRGSYVFYTNEKNQVKCVEISKVEVIEVEENEIFKSKFSNSKTKKVNPANFMSSEEFSKSKYSTMSMQDFEAERRRDAMNSKSW
jgi:hypothetical protein